VKPGLESPLTKADYVAKKLREDIAAGVISRGDRLDQRDLAARFGVSPTPVREALVALSAEGVLVHRPNQGITVADVTSDSVEDLEEIYQMRQALERIATERAHEHLSRAQLAELGRINDTFVEAMAAAAFADAQVLNYSLHMRIYERAQAPRMFRVIETLWTLFPWDTLWVMRAGAGASASVRHHERILHALAHGTAEEAGEAMDEHIRAGYEALVAGMAARDDAAPA
jgi:DNA-binding GntR family transcriptional regulator